MVMVPHFKEMLSHHITEKTRTNMSGRACHCSKAVWKYIRHFYSCDIKAINDSSDSRQKPTRPQDSATVWISNMYYSGFLE